MPKPKLWVSYAWDDNRSGDIDFVCQRIEGAGIEVKIDRTVLGAGMRLWPQIEHFITDPAQSDAWAFYATQTSITREACKEELAYALDRAHRTRGEEFSLIGVTPSPGDISLFPASVRTRLCVSLEDQDWLERIKAAVERRPPSIIRNEILPFDVKLHQTSVRYFIEVRPRAGTWHPFFFGIPVEEKDRVDPYLVHGPSGSIPMAGMISRRPDRITEDGRWYLLRSGNQATPTTSFFLQCKEPPSHICFGPEDENGYIKGYMLPSDEFMRTPSGS